MKTILIYIELTLAVGKKMAQGKWISSHLNVTGFHCHFSSDTFRYGCSIYTIHKRRTIRNVDFYSRTM